MTQEEILKKVIFHLIDAKGILQVQEESVDNNYLIKWAEKLRSGKY